MVKRGVEMERAVGLGLGYERLLVASKLLHHLVAELALLLPTERLVAASKRLLAEPGLQEFAVGLGLRG